MGFLDELKKLTHPYDEDEDEYPDDAEAVSEPASVPPRANPFADFGAAGTVGAPAETTPQLRPVHPRDSKVVSFNAAGQSQMVFMKPENLDAAKAITDHLRSRRAVVINLETTPQEVSRRLVDAVSGAAYALDATVQKLTIKVLVFVPPNVDIMGDVANGMENMGLYF